MHQQNNTQFFDTTEMLASSPIRSYLTTNNNTVNNSLPTVASNNEYDDYSNDEFYEGIFEMESLTDVPSSPPSTFTLPFDISSIKMHPQQRFASRRLTTLTASTAFPSHYTTNNYKATSTMSNKSSKFSDSRPIAIAQPRRPSEPDLTYSSVETFEWDDGSENSDAQDGTVWQLATPVDTWRLDPKSGAVVDFKVKSAVKA